jgi:hypothetical protein
MGFTFDKKYLSILTERLIPNFIRERYPIYEEFIKTYLEFIEDEQDGAYIKIDNLVKTKDLDYIQSLTDTVLQDQLLESLYISLFGESKARYLSDLLNHYEFIGNTNNFSSLKGTKAGFQLFFLLFMRKFVIIRELLNKDKRHDGVFNYDGLINYDNRDPNGKVPFVYGVETELNLSLYQDFSYLTHPAGFFAFHLLQCNYFIPRQTGMTMNDYWTLVNPFIAFYDTQTGGPGYFGHARVMRQQGLVQLSNTATEFDLEFTDTTKWNILDMTQTGQNPDVILYETIINNTVFTNPTFNQVKLIEDPTPGINSFNTTIDTGGTYIAEGNSDSEITIDNHTVVRILIQL